MMKPEIMNQQHISHLKAILYHLLWEKAVLLGILPKINAIQIVTRNVENLHIITPQYFGFEYAGFRSCSKQSVTKHNMILFLSLL